MWLNKKLNKKSKIKKNSTKLKKISYQAQKLKKFLKKIISISKYYYS